MKLLWMLALGASCTLVGAQTNSPAAAPERQKVWITSDRGYFEGASNQMIYIGHVVVTDHDQANLTCGRLTICLPTGGGRPTNIVAETDVVVDLKDKSQTYHITSQKAVYDYHVVNTVTNETITFTGGNPKPRVVTTDAVITGEPLVYDVTAKRFGGTGEGFETILKSPGSGTNGVPGTNASPFNIFH